MTGLEKRLKELAERLPIYSIVPYGFNDDMQRWMIMGEGGEEFAGNTLSAAVDSGLAFCNENDEEYET